MANEAATTRRDSEGDLLWPAVLLLILVAPTQYSHALDPKDGPFILYADLLAALLAGIWLISVLARRRWGQIVMPPLAIWALLGVAVLSAAGATSLKSAVVEIAQMGLYFVVVFAMFADQVRGQHRMMLAVKALMFSTTVIVLLAVWQYFSTDDPALVRGTFGNRNVYSGFLVMVLPLFYGMSVWIDDFNQRVWLLGLVVIGAATMLAGPQFWGLVIVLAAMSALRGSRTLELYMLGAAVFFAVMIPALPKTRTAVFGELADPIERGEAFKVITMPGEVAPPLVKKRWLEWQPALTMLGENLLLGVGVGNYQLNVGESSYYGSLPNAKKSEPDTNSLYLVIASSMGLMGLVALIAFMGYFVGASRKLWRTAGDHWALGLVAGMAGSAWAIAIANIFGSLFVRGNSLIWALLFAMIASAHLRGLGRADDGQNPARVNSRTDLEEE